LPPTTSWSDASAEPRPRAERARGRDTAAWLGAPAGFWSCWALAALLGVWLAFQPAHPLSDVSHYKYWTRLVTTEGLTGLYAGTYPESYAIYPPVPMLGLWLVGALYQRLVDPSFGLDSALASAWLTTAIRLLALAVHLALGLVLYRLLRRGAAGWQAAVSAGVYLVNPGALWDVAVWAQPDAWHALFLLLAVWQAGWGRSAGAGLWLGLALMTKPQAWVLAPVIVIGLARRAGPVGLVRAALTGGVVVALVVLPFALAGRLGQLLTLPRQISSVMPVASANAHNVWWIVTRATEPFVLDSAPLAAGLSYRQAGLTLLLATLVFALWPAWRARDVWELAAVAAFFAQAWFCLTVGAHENHQFMLFPLLCLVWWRDRFLAAILLVLVVAFSFNVMAHDFGLVEQVEAGLGPAFRPAQLLASVVNLLVMLAWGGWLAIGRTWSATRSRAPRSRPAAPA
jgi:hypothetical protein